MRGRLFEKVGVHTSTVFGAFSPEFAKQVKGAADNPRFWASGISLIAHMKNPRVPAVHMNTRMIVTTESWFGGGADLNPTLDAARTPRHPDTVDFHARLKRPDGFDAKNGSPNTRNGPTPISGCRIAASRAAWAAFYDHHDSGDWDRTSLHQRGGGLLDIRQIIRRRVTKLTAEERHEQAKWRGRYVEFNLLYDRGTISGSRPAAMWKAFCPSMPPLRERK
jgi:coproporphyrinogen III oxidase